MLVHSKIESSITNGPGNRAVIWFQGCDLKCAGCWNPDTHLFSSKNDVCIGEIKEWILSLKDVEGITFSGGEPLQHAPDLYVLMHWIKENTKLSIGMFTGYSYKELEDGRWKWHSRADGSFKYGTSKLWKAIKDNLDFAIMGRYNQLVACTDKPLCGSRNQEVKFFTDKYSDKDLLQQEVEIQIGTDGLIQLTGFPVGIDIPETLEDIESSIVEGDDGFVTV